MCACVHVIANAQCFLSNVLVHKLFKAFLPLLNKLFIKYTYRQPANQSTLITDIHMDNRALNRTPLGQSKMPIIERCPPFRGCTHVMYLGLRKVSCLWRCPKFRGVLIEGFHCIPFLGVCYAILTLELLMRGATHHHLL